MAYTYFLARWVSRWSLFFLRVGAGVCIGLLSGTTLVFGAEWSLEPQFRSEGQYHDNLRLTTLPHRSVWAVKASPSVGMQYATEIVNLKATPKFEYVRYFSHDPIEKTFNNFFLPFSGSYHTEVDQLGLEAALNRDNALISELQETGVVTSFIPRNYRTVRGTWDRALTERITFQSSYQLTDVTYNKTRSVNLFDYQVHTGTLGAEYQLTEETSFHTLAWYTNYHVPRNGFRSQAPGLELGFSHRLVETFSLSGSAGGRYVRTTLDQNGQRTVDRKLAWLVNVSLNKEWERAHLTAGYSRALNPSGNGVLFVTDRAEVSGDYSLTHALKATLRGTWTENNTVGSPSNVSRAVNSRYWQVSPVLSWRVTEYWSTDVSYRYSQRQFTSSSQGTAHSNAVFLSLTYTWPQWTLSR